MASTTAVDDGISTVKPGDSVILVIDDDTEFGIIIANINNKHGYKTLLVTSGAQGLRLAKTYRPLGILLDLGLPDMDGIEVLKELKSNRDLYNTPIYVISGRERNPEVLRQGIAGYLQKPLSDEQILDIEGMVMKQVAVRPCIIMVEGDGLVATMVNRLLPNNDIAVHTIGSPAEAKQWCDTTCLHKTQSPHHLQGSSTLFPGGAWGHPSHLQFSCKLVILGLDPIAGFKRCLTWCRELHLQLPTLPIMIYAQDGVSADQEAALRPYTDSIVVSTSKADKRLLENIERFACEVQSGEQKAITPTIPYARERLNGRHILVVDDDARNLFVVTSALEQQGARVSNAIDGSKALEALRKGSVDLIFMDIMMPKMDGFKAIAAIKADPLLQSIPIVVLTAKAFKEDQKQALEAGASDYLAKPVDYQVLVNMAVVWCDKMTSKKP